MADVENAMEQNGENHEVVPKKGRGRPAAKKPAEVVNDDAGTRKGRGRPGKAAEEAPKATKAVVKAKDEVTAEEPAAKKSRGRPKQKTDSDAPVEAKKPSGRGRGRPPGKGKASPPKAPSGKGRGRPKKDAEPVELSAESESNEEAVSNDEGDSA